MIKLYKFHFLIICLIGYSCGDGDRNSKVSNKIVLRVGQVEIPEYEFNKNLKRYLKIFYTKHKQFPPDDSIKVWVETYKENTILLAEAYALGYHNDVEIAKDVAFMARKMLTKRYGSLYEEVVTKRVKVSSELFHKAKMKTETEFELTYLKFKTREDMILVLGSDSIFTSREEFERAIVKSWNYPEVAVREYYFLWPDLNLFEIQDDIYRLEDGETSKPLYTSEGIFIVHIYYKGPYRQNISDNELKWLLEIIEKKKLEIAFDQQVYKSTKLVFNKKTCDRIFESWMSKQGKKIIYLDSSDVSGQLDMTIARYFLISSVKNITVREFIGFYNSLPIREAITNRHDLDKYVRDMAFEDYAFWLASTMKLDQNLKFQFDRRNYMNRLVLRKFLADNIGAIKKLTFDNLEANLKIQIANFEDQGFYISEEFRNRLLDNLQRDMLYKKSFQFKLNLVNGLKDKYKILCKIDSILIAKKLQANQGMIN